jgi:hypothetical protein
VCQLSPLVAAVSGFGQTATRPIALETTGRPPHFPETGEDNVGIRRIEIRSTQIRIGKSRQERAYGPRNFGINAGVFKSFPIPVREGMRFEFRMEFFSLTNTPNLNNPSESSFETEFRTRLAALLSLS